MLKIGLAALLALGIADVACAQAPTDHVKIDVTRADLQLIGQGIMKLPYETAAPLLIELQNQLAAQTPRSDAPATAPAAKAEPSADERGAVVCAIPLDDD
jgi:hypothetical protein